MIEREKKKLTRRLRPVREAAQKLIAQGDIAGGVDLFSTGFKKAVATEVKK